MPLIEMLGRRFGRLLITARAENCPDGSARWICQCDCGRIINTSAHTLRRGDSESCGCQRQDRIVAAVRKHGRYMSPEYQCWQNIQARCYRPRHESYKYYGAKGVTVCDRWRASFVDFFADMGERPSPKHSIDRMNTYGNYEPLNCRWATKKEQTANRRIKLLGR